MPEQSASKRTAPTQMETTSSYTTADQLASINPNQASREDNQRQPSMLYVLQDYAIGFLLLLLACLQYFVVILIWLMERIYCFLVKLYRVIAFCWSKPQHAKELFVTTIHLLRVSYDAGLWTWADCYETISIQMGKMTRTPTPTPQPSPTHEK